MFEVRRRLLSAALILSTGLIAAGIAQAELSPIRTGELLILVRHDCGSCHGLTLKGGLGPPLLPETLNGRDEEGIAEVILSGVPGTPMPPWKSELTRGEALWIAKQLIEGLP